MATVNLSAGAATAVYLSPAAGAHSITASYTGDGNFLPSVSAVASLSVGAMPDFTLAVSGSATQTVSGGGLATYALQVMPQGGAFSGAVSFSASGAQSGATVSFTPANVVPGTSGASVTMTVQTKALAQNTPPYRSKEVLAFAMLVPLMLCRRRRVRALLMLLVCTTMCGCGARTVGSARVGQTFPLTITATGTNLAGVVVTHATAVSLTVN